MIKINWEKNPLIPVVVQSAETKEVLMLGYMNEEAFKLTRATGYAHYYSRSRKRLWKKGESSNNTQKIEILFWIGWRYSPSSRGTERCRLSYRQKKLVNIITQRESER